jgi:hypothetical protein
LDGTFKTALRMGALALALSVLAAGQQGSNLDPPPPPVIYEEPEPETPAAPPEAPFWRRIDYSDPANLMKIALLLGSVLLARRAFREMQ